MRFPANLLDLLINHDAFRVCRIMPEREFIRYCKERNIKVDSARLRQFERIGVFRPLLRVFRPEITYKMETGEHGWCYAGELQEGEEWGGETRVEIAEFDPSTRAARNWRKEGLIWVPGQCNCEHEATIDTLAERHEAYYSRFQILPLDGIVTMLTMSVQLEWATLPDGTPNAKWSPRLRHNAGTWGRRAAAALRAPRDEDVIAVLLQLIANRFFYKTQSDSRQMTIGQFHDWEWGAYARAWAPDPFRQAVALDEKESRNFYEWLDSRWTHVDPVSRWYNLTRFVRIDKRKLLKDDALHGLALRDMAQMLRLFHREAFGKDLRPLGEVGVHIIKRVPDIDPEKDPMRALELSANDFGVNGKPQLVLFVEGETEQAILPVIFERLWGAPASRYGIEISNLGGVDNAAGGKEAPFSALWRLVDYLHHRQTLAFVLLDNEGYATRNVRDGLRKANSVHWPDRKATRRDHIKVWRTSFELENFSDTEIAQALNRIAGKEIFARADVAACRAAVLAGPKKGQKLLTIDRLFEERSGVPLNKPRLGLILVDIMMDPANRRSPGNRPITKYLVRVARKASRNFQPVTQEDWEINQRSGYLGTLQPAARRARRRRRDGRRRQQGRASQA
jgi:hypothetical protein